MENKRLQQLRTSKAWTQQQLADEVCLLVERATGRRPGLDSKAVGKFEQGLTTWPNSDTRRALRQIFHVETDADLGFYSKRSARRGEDPVDRRKFLASSVAAVGASAMPAHVNDLLTSEPGAMKQLINASRAHESRVEYFESVADSLGTQVIHVTPTSLLEPTLTAFRDARTLAGQCRAEADQKRLIRTNAKLATVTGEILFITNRFDHAREWYRTARYAADEVGDQYLSDIALAGQAYLPTYSDDPEGVLSLLLPRLNGRAPDTAATAWLWAFCGKAHANLGDLANAQRAFERSETALSNADPESVRVGIFSFLPEKLHMYQAHAYVSLSKPDKAISAAEQALSIYDPSETTEPALARFELASALLQAGDAEEACRQATRAITDPNVFSGISVQKRAERFNAEVPDHRNSAAREWADALWTIRT